MSARRCSWSFVLTCLALGCTSQTPEQAGPKQSFQQLVGQFQERATQKQAEGIIVTVTEQLQPPQASGESYTGFVRVRKETPADPAKNRTGSASRYEVRFVLEGGEWRCKEATSKDLDGEKVTGEHALRGPNIGLTNLFVWLGL